MLNTIVQGLENLSVHLKGVHSLTVAGLLASFATEHFFSITINNIIHTWLHLTSAVLCWLCTNPSVNLHIKKRERKQIYLTHSVHVCEDFELNKHSTHNTRQTPTQPPSQSRTHTQRHAELQKTMRPVGAFLFVVISSDVKSFSHCVT